MRRYTAVVERDSETGLYVGHVPGFAGAHSQGDTFDDLNRHLREVIAMLLEDGEPIRRSAAKTREALADGQLLTPPGM